MFNKKKSPFNLMLRGLFVFLEIYFSMFFDTLTVVSWL